MKSTCQGVVVAVVVCAVLLSVQAALGLPDSYLDKIYTTPDYTQTDSAYGGFPDEFGVEHGGYFCGPVSISNSLMWLADNGFTNLAPLTADRKKDQHDLVEIISSEMYLDAYEGNGCGPTGAADALPRYIADCGYQMKSLKWQGRMSPPDPYNMHINIPDLDWVREGIIGTGRVELWALGWNLYHPETDEYEVVGGHWVTMVGYDGDQFILHDPAPRNGYSFANEYVTATPLESGTRVGSGEDLTGQYVIEGDSWNINGNATHAILNGVYVLELESVVNLAPVAVEDFYTIEMNQTLVADGNLIKGVLDNDTDPNGDDLNVYYHHPTSTGVVDMDMETGNFTFTPREGFVGDTWFWYRTADEYGMRSEYSIARISVLPPGEANAVPEPSALVLLLGSMAAFINRRPRRQNAVSK